ncbi:MAG: Asp-tRNA(Asn)/Glu-tRNA(Gln) amidotransferase subunit GatC [Candidatus Omnitrophota bacterium]
MPISKETVEHVAHLARMELSPKELEKLSRQLQDILGFIDKLKKLNVDSVKPASHILPISNVLREDKPQDSLPREKVFQNAPGREGNFFAVPRVIE